jgi:hypothetical protein
MHRVGDLRRRNAALVAARDFDCTTEGSELDFSVSITVSAGNKCSRGAELRELQMVAVFIGLQFGLIKHGSLNGSGSEIEGTGFAEANFGVAGIALEEIDAVLQKIAIEENISGGGVDGDVIHHRLKKFYVAADGLRGNAAIATSTDDGAFGALDGEEPADVLQIYVCRDGFESEIAVNAFDDDAAGIGANLEFGFFGNGDDVIRFEIIGARGGIDDLGIHLDARAGLLGINRNALAGLIADDENFLLFPGFNFNVAAGVLQDYDRTTLHGEMLFDVRGCGNGDGEDSRRAYQNRANRTKRRKIKE